MGETEDYAEDIALLPHGTTHQDGGSDEVNVDDLSGELADEQKSAWAKVSGKPSTFPPDLHALTHKLGGTDEIDVTGLVGTGAYNERIEPAGWDFELADFTTDGNWHDLDLSAIVPAGAKAVILTGLIIDDAANSYLWLAKKGDTAGLTARRLYTQVANISFGIHCTIPCDADRKISYKASNLAFGSIALCVSGWLT